MQRTVLIADDHPLFREALSTIVNMTVPDSQIEQATNYQETWQALEQKAFNLVFIDLNMPDSNGLTDLILLKKTYPQIPMVVVSAHEEADIIRSCIHNNASGYIIKSAKPESIRSAITDILEGKTYVPENIDLSNQSGATSPTSELISSLTPSQLKVFIEIGKGKLNKQIAYDLEITEATVKAHITSIFKKLNINTRTQAVILAQQLKPTVN